MADSVKETQRDNSTSWGGWITFAGMMLLVLGSFQALVGFVALLDDSYYLVTNNGLVVKADFTTWGWIHLALGVAAIAAGIGALLGKTWGRVVGVALAAISAVANMLFLAAYPFWSMAIIAVDVIVIYALVAHGDDVKDW